MSRKDISIPILFGFTMLICSCDGELKSALNMAGNNRAELEKVLEHFKNDPEPLKFESAQFLIKNMPYNYSLVGSTAERYDSAFRTMSLYPVEQRDSVFSGIAFGTDGNGITSAIDLKNISADYLIRMIDDACDIWNQVNWKDDYDESVFFDYVLPYRMINEPLSLWREVVKEKYAHLYGSKVASNRGINLESEDCKYGSANMIQNEAASNEKMILLSKVDDNITFTVRSWGKSSKRLFFKYTTQSLQTRALLYVNDKPVDTLKLEPTISERVFRENRAGVDVSLKDGDNHISLHYLNEPFGLDLIRVSALENIDNNVMQDFSSNYCSIQNKKTGNYITFDVSGKSSDKPVELKSKYNNDSTQLIRCDYLGFPIWKIYAAQNGKADMCLEVKDALLNAGSPVVRNNYITSYQKIKLNHQKWVIIPIEGDCYKIMSKDSGLFLTSVRNKQDGKETLVVDFYKGSDSQMWKIEKCGERIDNQSIFKPGSAISEAMKVYDINTMFEWCDNKSSYMPKATTLLNGLSGNCREEGSFAVYLCRSLGIPAAIDFTPNWGNRSQGHTWNVLINPDGKSTPFFMGSVPGDTAHYSYSYKKPKVFRRRFSLNKEMANIFVREKDVPSLFRTLNIIDVTDEYYDNPVDVIRPVPEEYSDKHVAYICVFDNRNWVPVYYGAIKHGKVEFKCMGPDIVYMAALYDNGQFRPFGNPFLVAGDSTVTDIRIFSNKICDMTLDRKFPFLGKFSDINYKMGGGLFQGSNTPDFSQVTNLYKFEGVSNGNRYDVPVKDTNKYRYLRYLGPAGSHCNINELAFYDEKGQKLTGKIIGTEGEPKKTKETVFDGDILTGFNALGADGQWVGLRLDKPTRVGRIRFIARNDGNTIEKGDLYALCYWDNCCWNEFERKIARDDKLKIVNVPAGGLYILHDLTKGKEERLFTYHNGQQIWW